MNVTDKALEAGLLAGEYPLSRARECKPAMNIPEQAVEALEHVRKIISEAAYTGFNCEDGDWAERLFASQAITYSALKALLAAQPLMGVQRPEDIKALAAEWKSDAGEELQEIYNLLGIGGNMSAVDEIKRLLSLPHTGQPQEGAAQKDKLIEKLHVIAKNVSHALMSFTPGGSEYFTQVKVGDFEDYYADADACQRRIRERINGADAAPPPPVAESGWQLVPKVLSSDMIRAAIDAWTAQGRKPGDIWGSEIGDMYRAMLAAAPPHIAEERGPK